MSYQYIKRIPVQQQSADVKNVPCGTAILPGLYLQKLTTREPDDSQIEVAIAALKAVLPEEEPALEAAEVSVGEE